MYIPARHSQPDRTSLLAVIHAHPLATVVRHVDGELIADHIPLLLAENDSVLRGHVAMGNPLSQETDENPVLVIFNGPQSYISPAWCESKKSDPALVPTWNYVIVHVKGKLRHVSDPVWLVEHLNAVTHFHEAAVGRSWQVNDAPQEYLEKMMTMIMGIEIDIAELFGKWKTTVIKPAENVTSVTAALRALGLDATNSIAELIERRYQE